MAVVDASVLVALFHADEPHHDVCRSWLIRVTTAGEEIVIPVIALAEIAAAVSRGKGDALRAQQITTLLTQSNVLTLHPVPQVLAEQAADVAALHRIRGCDAIYVALAQKLDQPLITLDAQQLERAAAIVKTEKP
jgi:predicted nucleic acid-binding protein